MKKLENGFVKNHLNDHFLIGINCLYWKNTKNASISVILNRYPVYSKQFYFKYGKFEPVAFHIVIRDIKNKKIPIEFLDTHVLWDEYILDLITFFRMSNTATFTLLNKILYKFKQHVNTVETLSQSHPLLVDKHVLNKKELIQTHRISQENQSKLDFDENDEKMITFFQFKLMTEVYKNYSGSKLSYVLSPRIDDEYA